MNSDLVTQLSGLLGALIGGGTSLAVAIYTQRSQGRLQRVGNEVAKRETIYADFLMNASKWLLTAYTNDDIVLGSDERYLIGLINRMRLFAPAAVISGAEGVLKVIVEISLQPSVELRQLAVQSLSRNPEPDLLLAFSQRCRTDLCDVRRTTA